MRHAVHKGAKKVERNHQLSKFLNFGGEGGLKTNSPADQEKAIVYNELVAKHEIRGQKNSIALAPTYGRINRWCGSIDFELENDGAIMGTISRRDIADELRVIPSLPVPKDGDIRSFDHFMRGPPEFDSVLDPPDPNP